MRNIPQGGVETLKKRFNSFWKRVLQQRQDVDYFAKLSLSDFIELKKALSNINNIITMKVSEEFLDFLGKTAVINNDDKKKAKEDVQKKKACANGYDIDFETSANQRIIAEVKCNIPVNKNSFGAAQKAGIIRDIDGLIKGKVKNKTNKAVKDALKFMVLLGYENKDKNVECAVDKLLKNKDIDNKTVVMYKGGIHLNPNHVYIVIIPLK